MIINFKADRVFLKTLRSDRSFRIELDVGEYEYNNIKDIPLLPEGIYKIRIEPDASEETKREE